MNRRYLAVAVAAVAFPSAALGSPAPAAQRLEDEKPLRAIVFRGTGTVSIVESGRTVPVRRSLRIAAGATVKVGDHSTATVSCSNDWIVRIVAADRRSWTLDEAGCRDGQKLGTNRIWTYEAAVLADASSYADRVEMPSGPRAGGPDERAPVWRIPGNTAILEARPALAWKPSPGAAFYDFDLAGPGGTLRRSIAAERVKCDASACRLDFPSDWPDLTKAKQTLSIQSRTSPEAEPLVAPPVWLRAVPATEAEALDRELLEIDRLGLDADDPLASALRGTAYREHGLLDLSAQSLARHAANRIAAGETYEAMARFDLADREFSAALDADDPTTRAAAGLGLGRLAILSGDTAEAESRFIEALRVYREMGDSTGAQKVETALAALPRQRP